MSDTLRALVAAVDAALDDADLASERAKTEAMRPAMSALLADADALPPGADEPFEGAAIGNLLHADPDGRYHVLAVVFPEGTSSGVHHHGCWGLIGYYRGGDEETRYLAEVDGERAELTERDRRVFTTGDITALLPEDDDGWHRVRNPGPGSAVSIHVLCRTPAEHPHRFWQRDGGRVVDFPFVEVAPGRWRAEIAAG